MVAFIQHFDAVDLFLHIFSCWDKYLIYNDMNLENHKKTKLQKIIEQEQETLSLIIFLLHKTSFWFTVRLLSFLPTRQFQDKISDHVLR